MSQRLRISNLRSQEMSRVLNVCPEDDRILQWASRFEEKALNMGRWWGSVQLARFCLSRGCLVLPREVALIEAANLNGVPVQMGNLWYQFVHPHGDCSTRNNSAVPCRGFVSPCGCCGCRNTTFEDKGTQAAFSTTTGTNQKIRFYPGNAQDVGKTIIVQGYDNNGNWVRSGPSTARIDGETVTLAQPYVDTVTVWNPGAPTGIIKEVTQYRVLAYAVDATTGDETSIADYQPSETEPMYRVMSIPNFNGTGCNGSSTRSLLAVVSLQHIPFTSDQDWLIFTNLAAYKMGMMAEKAYEENNTVLGDAYFFGQDRNARNARGVLRHSYGMGALPLLSAELRKQTGDLSTVDMKFSTMNLAGFI